MLDGEVSMSQPLDYDGLVCVLRAGAVKVKSGAEELGRLDSAIGDGDHGVAMRRAMEALEKGIDGCPDRTGKALLSAVGWSVMSIDAGSTGPLLGSLLTGLAAPVGDAAEIDAGLLASMFEAGLTQLRTITTAAVGDKTMMDALAPAVAALQEAAAGGDTVAGALQKAAAAAEAGAASTQQFQAKFGKARNLGPRSLGHQDPGATSLAMFFAGCAEGAASLEH